MENAVIYARYSSHSQTEQSIEGQIAAAKKYALEHNYEIIAEYCDRAKTGTNDNREEFQRMLSDTAKHQFSVIIVWKVDRFGRNREEIAFNKHHCKKNRVRVEYVAENISNGPEGVILESVLEGMAEYYSLQLSQNIRRGMLESAKKYQCPNGRPPLGYRTKSYEIDPETAPIVVEIFEQVANGKSYTEVMNWLNDHHYRTSQGREFTKNSLPRILNNETYLGNFSYTDQIYAEGVLPAIISRDLWDRAHEKLQNHARRRHSEWSRGEYLLSGKLFCGDCGASMIGVSGTGKLGTKYHYYECVERRRSKTCSSKVLRSDLLEKKILEFVQNTILTDDSLDRIVDLVWGYYTKADDTTLEIKRLESLMHELEESRNNLLKAVERGLDYSLVEQRLSTLSEEYGSYRKELNGLELSRPLKLTKEHLRLFLGQFQNLDYSYKKYQKKLIDTFINSITVYNKELVIALNYSENDKPFKCSTSCGQVELSTLQSNPIVQDNVILFKIEI